MVIFVERTNEEGIMLYDNMQLESGIKLEDIEVDFYLSMPNRYVRLSWMG